MNRRTMLALMGVTMTAGVGGIVLNSPKTGDLVRNDPKPIPGRLPWRNWSGNLVSYPENRFAPNDEQELREALLKASTAIRVVGSSHSFSALVPTNGTMISLDLMGGIKSIDLAKGETILGTGGKIAQLALELDKFGAAFPSLPDINKQSLGGSIATATHGSGMGYSSMSSEVTKMRLMTISGDVIECSREKDKEVFSAARVGLGSLGVITEVGYNIEPSYNLTKNTWVEEYGSLISRSMDLFKKHRSFEFYYLPFTGMCYGIAMDKTELPLNPAQNHSERDNDGLSSLKKLRDYFGWSSTVRRHIAEMELGDMASEQTTDLSWKMFASEREVRFNEMEYHIPVDKGLDALDEVIHMIEAEHREVFFPIEVRYIKGDDAMISPFQGGDRISIAIHVFYEDDYEFLFTDIEPIFKKYQGRPHWGKMHSQTASELKDIYPYWNNFSRIRNELDPQNKLINDYLKQVLGINA